MHRLTRLWGIRPYKRECTVPFRTAHYDVEYCASHAIYRSLNNNTNRKIDYIIVATDVMPILSRSGRREQKPI